MKNSQRKWHDIANELMTKITESKLGPSKLAKHGGITVSAAWRLSKGDIKNKSQPAIKLCEHFKIDLTESNKSKTLEQLNHLQNLIVEVWDESPSHLKLLEKLILSTKDFKVEGKSEKI